MPEPLIGNYYHPDERKIITIATGCVSLTGAGLAFWADKYGLPDIGRAANSVFKAVGSGIAIVGSVVFLNELDP